MTILDALTAIAQDPTQALFGAGATTALLASVASVAGVVTWALRWRTARAAVDVEAERTRRHEAKNAAQVEMAHAEADAAVLVEDTRQVPTLVEKIEQLWQQRDECKEELRRQKEERAQERAADRAACDEEIRPLREQLATVAKIQRSSLPEETTGVHHLDEIIASNTPMPERPTTIVPPAGDPEVP